MGVMARVMVRVGGQEAARKHRRVHHEHTRKVHRLLGASVARLVRLRVRVRVRVRVGVRVTVGLG